MRVWESPKKSRSIEVLLRSIVWCFHQWRWMVGSKIKRCDVILIPKRYTPPKNSQKVEEIHHIYQTSRNWPNWSRFFVFLVVGDCWFPWCNHPRLECNCSLTGQESYPAYNRVKLSSFFEHRDPNKLALSSALGPAEKGMNERHGNLRLTYIVSCLKLMDVISWCLYNHI